MTPSPRRRQFLRASLVAAGGWCALPRLAAAAPAAGSLLFGFTPSPKTDVMLATLLHELRSTYPQPLGPVPRYVPGNGGNNAVTALLAQPNDGSALLVAASSTTTLAPLVGPSNGDRAQGLLPIGPIASFTFAFAVGPAVPAAVATMADYLHWLRSDSSCDNSYGAWAPGTGSHFAGLQISRHSEVPLQAVPYRGSPALLADLEAGHLPAAIVVLGTVMDSARTGKVRLLGVTSETRWPLAPQIPTLIEQGASNGSLDESFGLYVARGTPPGKVAALTEALDAATRSLPLQKAFIDAQMIPFMLPSGDYAAHLARERRHREMQVAQMGSAS